jgi:hypothetical protein
MLMPFVSELDRIAPSFPIDGSQIRVLQTPAEFYETLKVRQCDECAGFIILMDDIGEDSAG